jgi:hypothetical protein
MSIYYVTPTPALQPEPGSLGLNEQHAEEAINHLIEFFRKGPRNQAFLRTICEQIQELEQAFWDLYSEGFLSTAEGAQLDQIGEIVGEARQDRLDATYRAAIRIRVLVNKSNGKTEELIEIADKFTIDDPDAIIIAGDFYPAAMTVEVRADFTGLPADLRTLLRQAKPGGVNFGTITAPRVGAFLWSTVAAHGTATTTTSFGRLDGSTGGVLAAVG